MSVRVGLAVALLGSGVIAASPEGPDRGPPADEVLSLLQEARATAGVGRLEHREVLTLVAQRRAALVASLPHAQRLSVDRSIGEDALAAGSGPFLRLKHHLDLSRGAQDPGTAFIRNWRRYDTWSTALDPDFDAVGLGIARGDDGWMVLVVVLFQDMPVPEDLPALERQTIDGINAVRRRLGLGELVVRDWLSDVARRHSQDMARRDYVGHRSPDGMVPGDRVRVTGRRYRKLAENIYMGSGLRHPAQTAVDAWMGSREHRKNIETPGFAETGLGIAVDASGRVYFTQLFCTPTE